MSTRFSEDSYNVPETFLNLDETAVPEPATRGTHYRPSLETARTSDSRSRDYAASESNGPSEPAASSQYRHRASARPDSEAVPGRLQEFLPTALPPLPPEPITQVQSEQYGPSSKFRLADDEKTEGGTIESIWGSPRQKRASEFATTLYTISHLIFFSILGTLARLGLQALTIYPGTVVSQGVLWANFGGSLLMGFLAEDRKLFAEEWGKRPRTAKSKRLSWWRKDRELVKNSVPYHRTTAKNRPFATAHAASLYPQERIDAGPAGTRASQISSQPPPSLFSTTSHSSQERKRHKTVKKTIPLYIGLSVGFCGSFTSFSSFQRDVFLSLSNSAPPIPGSLPLPRNGGFSFLALLATLILTPTLCQGALKFGAHVALALDPWMPRVPFNFTRSILDRVVVVLGWGCWLGAIVMTILPPDRPGGPVASASASWSTERWRGDVLFALVFAPIGCLLRFYISLLLNSRISSFPLGTFVVNILGTALEGIFFDLQHRPSAVGGGRIACQALGGMMDGFCGCLTTVSTWVAELEALRLGHGYRYGVASLAAGLAVVLVVMGPVRWTGPGFEATACSLETLTAT